MNLPLAHEHTAGAPALPSAAGAVLLAACYLPPWWRARRRNREHAPGPGRAALFVTGCALTAVALSAPLDGLAALDFRGHMLQHLLLGMYAPLFLVSGAPITVLLLGLPASGARRVVRALRSRPARLLAHPWSALLLSTGSLGALYFTPLYQAATATSAAHALLHAHFLAAGCLFAWTIAGPDPAPGRPSVPTRLIVLGAAIAAHACLSQLLYAGVHLGVRAPVDQIRGGAELMYYGGDLAELLLAGVLVTTWRPRRTAVSRDAVRASPA